MESSIWLLGYLYSKQSHTCLTTFLQALDVLNSGVQLFSQEFNRLCPAMAALRQKYTQAQLQAFVKELHQSAERGHLLLYPGHELFPESYLTLEEVPYLLRLKGAAVWKRMSGLAVVGSREPSRLSQLWMDRHLGQFLRQRNCFTVSGGARGVDQKTHILSLTMNRPTVVLVPAGLNRMYPSSLLDLEPEILARGGAFLSEYEDDRMMQKHFFLQRNRLISGLGKATLIVEARLKSGTLITAQEAIEQHKPVWVLPGHPLDPMMQGSLDLLIQGAAPVQNASDLLMLFGTEIHDMTEPDTGTSDDLVQDELSLH
jgi:DNA processing protein